MAITRSIIAAGALALTTGTALVFAAPAFADPTGPIASSSATLVDPTAPVTDTANAVVGPELSEDQVDAQLRSLAGTQSQAEIDRILTSGLRSAMMTDSDTAEVVAAVVLPVDLRTLTPVTPGCTATSICLKNGSGTPFAYEGFGSRTGRWTNIRYGYAYGFGATFQWTGGTVRVPANAYNYWGSAVTVTKISR